MTGELRLALFLMRVLGEPFLQTFRMVAISSKRSLITKVIHASGNFQIDHINGTHANILFHQFHVIFIYEGHTGELALPHTHFII